MNLAKYISIIFLITVILIATEHPKIPGFFYADSTVHEIYEMDVPTGDTLNVLDYGADPADNDHDDRPAIEEAMTAADYGDIVYIPNGVYNLNSQNSKYSECHLKMDAGIHLWGESMDSTILISSFGDSVNAALSTTIIRARYISYCSIKNLWLTSDYDGEMPTDIVNNNEDTDSPMYGIYIDGSSTSVPHHIIVDSCRIEYVRRMMVRVARCQDVIVRNCIFKNATDVGGGGAGYGVSIQGTGNGQDNLGLKYDSRFNLVENCQFYGPYVRHGVIIQYFSHNNWVRNNYFDGLRLDAIDLHGEDEYCNEVEYNTVENVVGGGGVGLGNTGSTHDASGERNYIHDNIFRNCREGVKTFLGTYDTRIENNLIENTDVALSRGIYVLNAPGTIIKNNVIKNNTSAGFYAIRLDYDNGTLGDYYGKPQYVVISGNEITNNAYGLFITNGDSILIGKNDIHDNGTDIFIASDVLIIYISDTTSIDETGGLAKEFKIGTPYPNPFNPKVTIPFKLAQSEKISVKIFDVQGREVTTLFKGLKQVGSYQLVWQPLNFSSGNYWIQFQMNDKTEIRQICFMK